MAQSTVRSSVAWLAAALSTAAGCDRGRVQEPEASHSVALKTAPESATVRLSDKLSRPAAARLVAVGDLHGDLEHTRRALRLAGAIGAQDEWRGGSLRVVQTGDEIDRGDDDRAILDSVEQWQRQAAAAGGEFIALLGNHELMNAASDFRYVTPSGFGSFLLFATTDAGSPVGPLAPERRGRGAAFAPGGAYATLLARRPIFMKVGDTVFVHGGILPKHVRYGLDRMNDEVSAWLMGRRAAPPDIMGGDDAPVWTRQYSAEGESAACSSLAEVLSDLRAKRMVVGHTVQAKGITSACEGRVWRIDVGLSHAFGGPIEVLQIEGDRLTVLHEP